MIGEKIKELAKEHKYKREKMASLLGVSAPTYDRICKSDNIDIETLRNVCQIFDKDISFFLEDVDATASPKSQDGGRFGSEVEEELRAQIEMLKRDKEFLQMMLERFSGSFEKLADELGKEKVNENRHDSLTKGSSIPLYKVLEGYETLPKVA